MILDEIFQDYHEDEYDLVQSAFDKISGNHDCERVHREVYRAYQQNPDARVMEIALPRQSGKSTWIRQIAERYPKVMRVYPTMSVMKHHVNIHSSHRTPLCYTTTEIYRGVTRGKTLDIDLILLDDVYVDHTFLDNRNTIMETLYANTASLSRIPRTVSLYTPG
jgi:hypothetical protein